jgi:hypothetical protein
MAISAGWCDSYSSVTCCELVRASAALCDVTAASVRPVDTEDSAPAPSPSGRSSPQSARQQFSEWLSGRVNVDPLAPPADAVNEGAAASATLPTCCTSPIRCHQQRIRISPEDTLYNLGGHLRDKEITIRLRPDGTFLVEVDDTIPPFNRRLGHSYDSNRHRSTYHYAKSVTRQTLPSSHLEKQLLRRCDVDSAQRKKIR